MLSHTARWRFKIMQKYPKNYLQTSASSVQKQHKIAKTLFFTKSKHMRYVFIDAFYYRIFQFLFYPMVTFDNI